MSRFWQKGAVSRPASIEEIATRTVAWRRRALLAMLAFGGLTLGLAAHAPVQQVAFAPGELSPADGVAVLRHVTGGQVAEVAREVDAEVAAGDLILRLEDPTASAEHARLAARRAHAALTIDRLQALLADTPFEPGLRDGVSPLDIDTATRLYRAERAELASELAGLRAQIAERQAEANATKLALRAARAEAAAFDSQTEIAKHMSERQLGTWRALLEAEARQADSEARLAEIEGRHTASASVLLHLESELERVNARRRADWSKTLTEAMASKAEVDAALSAVEQRLAALELRAPIAGRLLQVAARRAGDAIAPGGVVAQIVPNDAGVIPALVAEVRVAPKDVGYVSVGDAAKVSVSAFDAEDFGVLQGTVASVSPSAVTSADAPAAFRVRIALERDRSRGGDARLRLSPGMEVSARIQAAERNLLQYLLEPITKSFDVAFAER